MYSVMVRFAKGLYYAIPCLCVRPCSGIFLLYENRPARTTCACHAGARTFWFRRHHIEQNGLEMRPRLAVFEYRIHHTSAADDCERCFGVVCSNKRGILDEYVV